LRQSEQPRAESELKATVDLDPSTTPNLSSTAATGPSAISEGTQQPETFDTEQNPAKNLEFKNCKLHGL
jgi:hypothetical protein